MTADAPRPSAQCAAVRMLAPPDFQRRVDVPDWQAAAKLAEGWKRDPFPDDRPWLHATTPGRHAGRPALVCANGPSLGMLGRAGIDRLIASLGDPVVWGVNDVWRAANGSPLPCDYVVVLDEPLWQANRDRFIGYFAEFPTALLVTCFDLNEDRRYQRIPINIHATADTGPAYEVNAYFHGMSSGIAAAQMAIHCGCSPVYLIGHDCTTAAGRTHSFGVRHQSELAQDYPQGRNMLAGYSVLARHAAEAGVRILNLSGVSAIPPDVIPRLLPPELPHAAPPAQARRVP